ncbi:MAG: hypothetical protein HY671_15455 [Chloroflexi bacterium]|nr:hypothetical protein [Chloroflexota bacterium]
MTRRRMYGMVVPVRTKKDDYDNITRLEGKGVRRKKQTRVGFQGGKEIITT